MRELMIKSRLVALSTLATMAACSLVATNSAPTIAATLGLRSAASPRYSPGRTTPSGRAPAATRSAEVGDPCAGPSKNVDAGARPVTCATTGAGRRWVWSSPIPASVGSDAPLPPSWAGVLPNSDGINADPASPPLSGNYPSRAAMENRLVEIVNAERALRGLKPVSVDWRLTRLARWWAQSAADPANAGRGTTHCPPTVCSVRAAELGYLSFGEVIRPWSPMPAGDMAAERFFVDSPRHLAILTEPRITHIAFGVFITPNPDGSGASLVVVGQVGRAR